MQKISMTWQESLFCKQQHKSGMLFGFTDRQDFKMTYSTFQMCKQIPSNKQGTFFCENWCQGITNILNAQQYISHVYTTLRHHRNCPDRRWVTVPPHWHIWSLCTFSLFFQSVLNTIPNWTWPQISIERWMGSVCIISERAQSSGRCRGCPHCW